MASQGIFRNWSRGYVFAVAREPETAAEKILQLNEKYNEEEGFIIRADTIKDPSGHNLVVPVNANSEGRLNEIADQIKEISGDEDAKIAIVERYYPYPPHKAKGIITEEEVNPDRFGIEGRNVWG
ncbi:hypothetical protein KA005_32520 [bacterium]|nr:hypothetical protein [bacterium]